jgi:hypothetical protein
MSELTRKQAAELARMFTESEFGQFMMLALSQKYNELHHAAEDETLGIEKKAMIVERAAGLKIAIDFIVNRTEAAKLGEFKDDKE